MNQKWLTPLLLIGALTGWLLGELAGGNEALDYLMRIARALFLDALRAVIGPLILFRWSPASCSCPPRVICVAWAAQPSSTIW